MIKVKWSRLMSIGLVAIVVACGHAYATDHEITGKKLLLRSTGKLVLLSKDDAIGINSSDPVGGSDSSLSFNIAGSPPVTFALPATNWVANGSGTLFRYKNASAPDGPSPVKVAKVKDDLLKVVAKDLPFAVPEGFATINVVLKLNDGSANTYCMTFNGTGDGNKFLVKDAAQGDCPFCGDNDLDGTEQCDGTLDGACPGSCQANCMCPAEAPCPSGGGDATACNAFSVASSACYQCCSLTGSCLGDCFIAASSSCSDGPSNDACTGSVNATACAAECCP